MRAARPVQLQVALDWNSLQSVRCRMDLAKHELHPRLSRSSFTFLMLSAVCGGCVNGGCNNPGECFCNAGFHGLNCSRPMNLVPAQNRGLGVCVYRNVTSPCTLADGIPRSDCPTGYAVVGVEPCPDIEGFSRRICEKRCCDGWGGIDCRTREFSICGRS